MKHETIMMWLSIIFYATGIVLMVISFFRGGSNTWSVKDGALLAIFAGLMVEMYLLRERIEIIG
jgi:hypothetical protein